MSKRKRPHRHTLQPASSQIWRMRVTETVESTLSLDGKAALITEALIEAAIDTLVTEAEGELADLKGKRGSEYTNRRKELREKIAFLRSKSLHAQSKPSVPYDSEAA